MSASIEQSVSISGATEQVNASVRHVGATMSHVPGIEVIGAIPGCALLALLWAVLVDPLASQTPSETVRLGVTPEFIASEVARAQSYFVVMYTLGPTPRTNPEHVTATQQQHLEYLFNLRRAGVLTGQGPVLDGGEVRGIGIFIGVNEERARQLTAADPHVKAGYLNAHVFEWMGLPGDSLPHLGRTDVPSLPPTGSASSGTGGPAVTPEFIATEIARAQSYVIRLYTLGPTPRTNAEHVAATQKQHLEYLFNLRRAGRLTLAGPVFQGPMLNFGELRGIGILVGVDEEEARQLAAADPHVKAGYLKAHVFRWMGLPGDRLPHMDHTNPQPRP